MPRTVVRRIRMDWPVVAAAWVLLVCATSLLTGGALYGDAVALGGLRSAIAGAAAADRSIVVDTSGRPTDAAVQDRQVRAVIQPVIDLTGGEIASIVTSSSFARAGTSADDNPILTEFASYDGIERHAALDSGRWAAAGASPQEATLSRAAAGILGLGVGDHVALVSRLQSSLIVNVVITGVWQPDPADPYWLDPDLELGGSIVQGTYTTAGPLVVPAADLVHRPFGDQRSFEWRALMDPSGVRVDALGAVRAAVDQVPARLKAAVGPGVQFRISTALPAILAAIDRSVLVSRTGVLLLVIQYGVLALYAIVLVAGMLSDRRRAETALLRTRGASSVDLAAMGLMEATVLAGSAAILAPGVAMLAVRWLASSQPLGAAVDLGTGLTRGALVVDLVSALVGIAALTLPTLGGGSNLAGVRAAISRQTGTTLARRLGLDLALVAVAAIALWQLRTYGAPLTRTARGLLGIDPLLVGAPAIGLLAGAVIATRLLPRAMELVQGPLERSRGFVAPMGGRGLARRPLRYTRSVLLLMLAASLGTFAAAHVATWTRSQDDQAAYQAGAAVRVVTSPRAAPGWALAATYAAIPGVDAIMPVDRGSVDSGRIVRGAPLLGIDASLAGGIMNPLSGPDGAALPAFLRSLAAGRPAPLGVPIPADARELGVVLDAAMVLGVDIPDVEPVDLTTYPGIHLTIVVVDGLGRIARLSARADGMLAGLGQRLVVDLSPRPGAPGLRTPARLVAIELSFGAPSPEGAVGTTDLVSIDASADAAASGTWTPIGLQPSAGWTWRIQSGNARPAPLPAEGAPWRLTFDPEKGGIGVIFNGASSATTLILAPKSAPSAPLPVIASPTFLDATGAGVGDDVPATLDGVSEKVHVVGTIGTFPTLDPNLPFLVIDDATLAMARYLETTDAREPGEWWIASRDARSVAAAVRAGGDPGATVITTADRASALLSDPIPRGVIGVLGLGSLAALAFASIGFVVSATVSTRERLGEFALLRALGLSGRELSGWLAIEQALMLMIGVVLGIALGVLLSWLVLPFATLTSAGVIAVPTPDVIIPWSSLGPILIGAAVVLAATLGVLQRQLLGVRISDVLRGVDE